jgi:hypothetical protein
MKKISIFLIISIMLVGLLFANSNITLVAGPEIPEPKAIRYDILA